jgi:hypothetical protein
MKQLLHRIFKKTDKTPLSSRITNDTVVQHREKILAGGRRFKYPIQYTRHKIAINAIIISLVALLIAGVVGWWQLYIAQNTSELMYHITKILPVPIATVDGQEVLYSDYLMKYLSSVHYLEQKEQVSLKTDDGKRQVAYIKQQSMEDTIADAYAKKLAGGLNISISDSELEGFLKEQRQSNSGEISEQTYDAVILDYYNWSPEEYRYVTKNKLLRQKVAYTIDKNALEIVGSVAKSIKSDSKIDLKVLANTINGEAGKKVEYGVSGWVPKTNQDGGLAVEATKLKKLELSPVVKSTIGDGYYFIRLLDSSDTQVSYEYIHVPLTLFTQKLNEVIKANKVNQYIKV